MEVKILSKCDADETKYLGNTSIQALEEIDLSADTYLSNIKEELSTENSVLSDTLSVERKHEYTEELANLDDIFDSRVICVKKFLEANTYSSDETLAKNAEKALSKMATYDLSFYKLGYEKELSRAFALIEDFEKPDMQSIITSLVGVSTPLNEMKVSASALNDLYIKNQDILALKEKGTTSSIQKKVILEIFNDKLLPYLMVMSRVNPTVYLETFTKITQYIETVNTKIRTRRNQATNEEEEVNSEVE